MTNEQIKNAILKMNNPKEAIEQIEESVERQLMKDNVSVKADKFIVFSSDHSGFGWADLLQKEGFDVIYAIEPCEDEEHLDEWNNVGVGILNDIRTCKEIMDNIEEFKDYYFLFDSNKLSNYSEELRTKGYKVFGASALSEKMEHDREFCIETIKKYGLKTPDTFDFENLQDGIDFLEENCEKAFVFKPNDSDCSHLTFVPNSDKDDSANAELRAYMLNLEECSYILQERKKGIEANFEVWLYKGEPFFAFCGLENKKKLSGDLGENVGCAMDLNFAIPIDCKAIKETVGKLYPLYKENNYTGFADMNVIIDDKTFWFLEVCNRFGYNAHPSLFLSLKINSFGDIMADFIDGRISNFYNNFKDGFATSVNLYIDHKRPALPFYAKHSAEKYFYPYDLYKEEENTFLAGYDHAVGVVCGHGYTITDSWHNTYENAEKIHFPDKGYRDDGDKCFSYNSPRKRYEALMAMKLF